MQIENITNDNPLIFKNFIHPFILIFLLKVWNWLIELWKGCKNVLKTGPDVPVENDSVCEDSVDVHWQAQPAVLIAATCGQWSMINYREIVLKECCCLKNKIYKRMLISWYDTSSTIILLFGKIYLRFQRRLNAFFTFCMNTCSIVQFNF